MVGQALGGARLDGDVVDEEVAGLAERLADGDVDVSRVRQRRPNRGERGASQDCAQQDGKDVPGAGLGLGSYQCKDQVSAAAKPCSPDMHLQQGWLTVMAECSAEPCTNAHCWKARHPCLSLSSAANHAHS